MDINPDKLPADPAVLQQMVRGLLEERDRQEQRLRRCLASVIKRFSSGRDSFEPLTPSSTYLPATSQPRREAYSRNSVSCISGCCPLCVETRAYLETISVLMDLGN
jgi:hypothetical protein